MGKIKPNKFCPVHEFYFKGKMAHSISRSTLKAGFTGGFLCMDALLEFKVASLEISVPSSTGLFQILHSTLKGLK